MLAPPQTPPGGTIDEAAVLREYNKPLEIEELEIDKPGPHEVLTRTAASGICHSDLHVIEGSIPMPTPCVLGHEPSGIVEAVGSEVTDVAVGDHVIGCLNAWCGHCEYCLTGRPHLCLPPIISRGADESARLSKGGDPIIQFALSSFAEYMLTHERSLVKIRDDMPLDRAALIGCGVTTGVGAALRTARVEPGASTAVIGCGGVGLSALQGLPDRRGRTHRGGGQPGVETRTGRSLGATDTVNASDGDPVEQLMELTGAGSTTRSSASV